MDALGAREAGVKPGGQEANSTHARLLVACFLFMDPPPQSLPAFLSVVLASISQEEG